MKNKIGPTTGKRIIPNKVRVLKYGFLNLDRVIFKKATNQKEKATTNNKK